MTTRKTYTTDLEPTISKGFRCCRKSLLSCESEKKGQYDGKEISRKSCVSDGGVVRYRRGDCDRAGGGGRARGGAGAALGPSGKGREADQGCGRRGCTDRCRRDERSPVARGDPLGQRDLWTHRYPGEQRRRDAAWQDRGCGYRGVAADARYQRAGSDGSLS